MTPEKADEIRRLLQEIAGPELLSVILSNAVNKEKCSKKKIRPVLVKDELVYQQSSFTGAKVFHANLTEADLMNEMLYALTEEFKQCEIETKREHIIVLISKKGTVTINRKKKQQNEDIIRNNDLNHNRSKQYILEEDKPIGFLIDLGVQTEDGKIIKAKYDKFRQINRYLEFVRDILPNLPTGRTLTIIDFGCGKSYLTFALYYYLHELNQLDIRVIGLDLKEDVIATCNRLRDKYHYDGLQFLLGDIGSYEGVNQVDMVVTLHACDTATDYALYKAVKWNASVILSVPCCQHEVNRQISSKELEPVLQYGIIKERMSALITDAVRANILTKCGYQTQILEFIDIEHTPKNLLIRGVKSGSLKMTTNSRQQRDEAMLSFLNINPTLAKLMKNQE